MSRVKGDERVYRRGARRMSSLTENNSLASGSRGSSLWFQNKVLGKSQKIGAHLFMEVVRGESDFGFCVLPDMNHMYI